MAHYWAMDNSLNALVHRNAYNNECEHFNIYTNYYIMGIASDLRYIFHLRTNQIR